MIKQRINRHTWLRGEGSLVSYLLRPSDQRRCCLGQALGDAGMTDDELRGIKSPAELRKTGIVVPEQWKWLLSSPSPTMRAHSEEGSKLMSINDNEELTPEQREAQLTKVFAESGVEVEFYSPVILLPAAKFGSLVIDELRKLDLDVRVQS
jgi:hypothetical protein